jgi:hypothetical protein
MKPRLWMMFLYVLCAVGVLAVRQFAVAVDCPTSQNMSSAPVTACPSAPPYYGPYNGARYCENVPPECWQTGRDGAYCGAAGIYAAHKSYSCQQSGEGDTYCAADITEKYCCTYVLCEAREAPWGTTTCKGKKYYCIVCTLETEMFTSTATYETRPCNRNPVQPPPPVFVAR